MKKHNLTSVIALFLCCLFSTAYGQEYNLKKSLKGFDDYIDQVMIDWNSPGIAVGIIIKDKLVYAEGFGYRDLEKKLPVTSKTLFPIASNTKLFTSVAMGMLVENGEMTWDNPISNYVPQIKFYNQDLYNNVTLRDMLSHRTGISRHDFIWYKSDFTRKELFDRLIYLEPAQPMRQSSLYNNLMYAAAGYCLELKTGKTWEDFVKTNIFNPLAMNSSIFTIEEMEKSQDFAYPYYEDRDTDQLVKRPFYREQRGIGPAGAIISNLEDMSHWVSTLIHNGEYNGKEVIPASIIKETIQPSIANPNTALETKGYDEILNTVYGMGRSFSVYKGHLFARHGGAIGGFYSQVSMMPTDSIGVVVFVNGAHNYPLVDFISFNIYDRLLGLGQTDFNGRNLKERIDGKKAYKEAIAKVGSDKIPNTQSSHPMADYVGLYEDPAYGKLNITMEGDNLQFDFHNIVLPLGHYHYDRFDTPDDQVYGKYSVNFSTNPQGDIHTAVISLDEGEVNFVRKPDASLSDPATLARYVGQYELAGDILEIVMKNENTLVTKIPGSPEFTLEPYKPDSFTMKEFSDITMDFSSDGTEIKTLKLVVPNGVYEYTRKKE